jgi:hypothetical protein
MRYDVTADRSNGFIKKSVWTRHNLIGHQRNRVEGSS